MFRRTPDVVESLLEWAGYGLGYSEEEALPVDEQAARAAPAAKPAPVVRPVLAARWRQRRSEPQPERQPESGRVLLPIQLPIQRDRNWKVLQRASLDERQRSGVDGQSPVIDSSEDTHTSQVFADVWSIGETALVDTEDTQDAREEIEAEAPAPVEAEEEAPPTVERLRRMLE